MEPEDLFQKLSDNLKNSEKAAEQEGFLEPWEIEAIIMSMAMSRGDEGFPEEEVVALIKWCEEQRIGNALVDLVCRGLANVDWKNGEPVFQISSEGEELYKGDKNARLN